MTLAQIVMLAEEERAMNEQAQREAEQRGPGR